MVYTGLRISDVGLFHMNRLKGNEVFLRAAAAMFIAVGKELLEDCDMLT